MKTYSFNYNGQEITIPNELVEKIGNDAVVEHERKIRDLEYEGCRQDIINYLEEQDDDYFEERGREVLNDKDLIDRLTAEHHKCVFNFGVEREYSCQDACDCEPGIEKEDEEDEDDA